MTSSPPFHPELAGRARALPRSMAGPWLTPFLRRATPLMFALRRSPGRRVEVGDASVYVYGEDPGSPARPALLWMHGGGLVFGDARQDEAFLLDVVRALGILVVSVQYRFPPEHPFPAALDDCTQAFHWMLGNPQIDPARIAVGGASAGGGLAAALCQRLGDEGGGQAALQLLAYPMLDQTSSDRTDLPDGVFRLWNRQANAYAWELYLRASGPEAPYAVPARAEQLRGLPPAWIGVGTLDLFHDEDLAYAERLRASGVPCELVEVPGAYHGFDATDPKAPVSQDFAARQIAALRASLF